MFKYSTILHYNAVWVWCVSKVSFSIFFSSLVFREFNGKHQLKQLDTFESVFIQNGKMKIDNVTMLYIFIWTFVEYLINYNESDRIKNKKK